MVSPNGVGRLAGATLAEARAADERVAAARRPKNLPGKRKVADTAPHLLEENRDVGQVS